jgi:YVTN family beta-propeller protein
LPGRSGGLVPVDLATDTVGPTIIVGNQPFGLAITPDGTTLYDANFVGGSVSVIDVATNTVTDTISGGGLRTPSAVAITPDGTTAYVADFNANAVFPIDVATNTIGMPLTGLSGPGGIAITPSETTTTLGVTPMSPAPAGTQETLSATLNPTDSVGTVQFMDGATPLGSPVTVTGGTATLMTTLGAGSHSLSAVFTPQPGEPFLASTSSSVPYLVVTTPVITWANPAPIVYGTPLGATQLDATANTPGTFTYAPAPGTVLHAGVHLLSVTFTPTDTTHFSTATGSVTIEVTPAPLTITAKDATRTFGRPNPAFSVKYQGFVNGDTKASLTGILQLTTTATLNSAPGTYPIEPSGLSSPDYTITYVNATLTITKAPTTTSVTNTPASPRLNQAVTFSATVEPNPATTGATRPSGTVSFFVDGSATAAATAGLSSLGTATFVTDLGGGAHNVVAVYRGDTNYAGSTSSAATTTVGCTTTITGTTSRVTVASGTTTCVLGAHLTGTIVVSTGGSLDVENSTVGGSITANGANTVRICGSGAGGAVTVDGSVGFVLIGDPTNGCGGNAVGGSISVINNTGGLVVVGNTYTGTLNAAGNSGAGPLPGEGSPIISDNTHV